MKHQPTTAITQVIAMLCRTIGTFSCLGLLAFVLSGCGSNTATIRGKVSYKNQAIPGQISFVDSEGKSGSGVIGPDGKYVVKAAPIGSVKVVIRPDKFAPGSGSRRKAPFAKPEDKATPPKEVPKIPKKYTSLESTDLSYTIKSGTQTIHIELKDE